MTYADYPKLRHHAAYRATPAATATIDTVPTGSNREIEVKLPLNNAGEGRRRLRDAGFRVTRRRAFEQNTLFDTAAGVLRSSGTALRLRTTGTHHALTYKGPAQPGPHKSREELELSLGDRGTFEQILARLGYQPVFRYEKYRTEYRGADPGGAAMLDETPVGVFLELEGAPEWIDRTAAALGFSQADYITATYVELQIRAAGKAPEDLPLPRP